MATPKKEQIIERAKELFFDEQFRKGNRSAISPTFDELRESGFIVQAQSELMRGSGYEYALEIEASKKSYLERVYKPNMGKFPIDFEECERSNILISGTNQQGKSLCAMGLSNELMSNGWQIYVFDNVGHWQTKSSIRKAFTIKEKTAKFTLKVGESVIFDISLLKPSQQRKFVEQILEQTWLFRVLTKPKTWLMIVFEEFQLYARNIRGNVSENILRMMSVGANYRVRCLGITPDLSLVDCSFIRLTTQRYHFRLGNEPNAKRRFRAYYGLDWCKVTQNLDVGYCTHVLGDKLQVWKVPLFEKELIEVKA